MGQYFTPRWLADLMADATHALDLEAGLSKESRVLDPCCGTGGFLIAAARRFAPPRAPHTCRYVPIVLALATGRRSSCEPLLSYATCSACHPCSSVQRRIVAQLEAAKKEAVDAVEKAENELGNAKKPLDQYEEHVNALLPWQKDDAKARRETAEKALKEAVAALAGCADKLLEAVEKPWGVNDMKAQLLGFEVDRQTAALCVVNMVRLRPRPSGPIC